MPSLNQISFGLLKDTESYAKIQKENEGIALLELNLNDIITVDFPENQYHKKQTQKKQIVLHHTVSGQGTEGDIAYWRSTVERVGTAIIVGWDGKIYQCFSTIYWAHHLGVTDEWLKEKGFTDYSVRNEILNKASIGIEIDAWGGLMKYQGQWYPAYWDVKLKKNVPNIKVKPIANVQEYPNGFRGFYGFEKYTKEQIEAVRQLIVFWNKKYGIPLDYNENMWDISMDALNGKTGIWTHTSFRSDKSDCHPQPELINMLKSLKK